MSNWFHRNPLKATSKITFDLGVVAESLPARSICHDLATNRMNLLKLLVDPAVTTESVLGLTQQYISLLMGFIEPPSNEESEDPVASNKLRSMVMFKWSNSAEPKNASPIMEPDALFEVCSMLYNVALWLTKHAAKLSAKDEVSTDEAKEVHTSLRHAAGLIQLIRDKYVSKLNSSPKPGDDLCADVMEAYIHQSVAEAQEAIIEKHLTLNNRLWIWNLSCPHLIELEWKVAERPSHTRQCHVSQPEYSPRLPGGTVISPSICRPFGILFLVSIVTIQKVSNWVPRNFS
ncbi:hypothetical protein CRM22_006694 [Opisthorchis felineus]|uniref:BRO1 domain-containing protein n=1 Tax=Opisthorchis felineus TaxID=147828 RepID=A0A4S2LRY9_OPIFE|nr:hypothetical protein CRM22_006694 [Opisthorchis felineus]